MKRKWMNNYFMMCFFIMGLVLSGCTSSANQNASGNQPNTDSETNTKSERQEETTESKKSGGTLRIIIGDDAIKALGYNPEIRSIGDLMVSATALETLGRYNTKGTLTPFLADRWQIDTAAKTITITIKEGIKFSDGTDFNAEAVKWNLEQYRLSQKPNFNETDTQSIEAPDATTVVIKLNTWDIGMMDTILTAVKMASPTAFKEHGKDWAMDNPVGTGPFVMEQFVKGVSVKFKKNENYWQEGMPYLDGVEWKMITDSQTASAAMSAGEADVYYNTSAKVAQDLQANFEVIKFSGFGAFGPAIYPSGGNPDSPWADERVRQALSLAIDREAIVKTLAFGYGTATSQYSSPGLDHYNDEIKPEFNPDKAKQLLADAGYADGFKTQVIFANSPESADLYTAIQSYLGNIGIELELAPVDGAKFREISGAEGSWEGLIGYVFRVAPDTSWDMIRNLASFGTNARSVETYPELDELMRQSRTVPDSETYKTAVLELQQKLFGEKVSAVPLYLGANTTIKAKGVEGDGMTTTFLTDWTPESAKMN
ncbi:ABC transporter substrate-binding protein [Paenibacillus fonticola]|uniref:ABC transporter substrate-binding protein n=1 Tax=Paenibacillus fonticola TaxID=379896 RepID=UPI00035C3B58|nr:ABC transporter substrate-binding protein [Paenibacillus fonticola]